ncbi:uncharacterized protein [Drosophila takahashii]|uniref:uncharacterized protein n=1 Tax=Drosophila takahashii TaxID=29030 RepID=UPI001CF8C28F|nr:uncharacterized protein LOC123002426 [Drosophila takahashii]
MAARIEVKGICPYCDRYVSRDLRPINMLSARDAKRISQLINEEPPLVQLEYEKEGNTDSRCKKTRVSKRKRETLENSESEDNMKKEPSSQDELDNHSSQEIFEDHSSQSGTSSAEDVKSENSLDAITKGILDLVEEEFERDPASNESSGSLRGNAEVIMAMLTEEQLIIDKIEEQASQRGTKEPPTKRRRC